MYHHNMLQYRRKSRWPAVLFYIAWSVFIVWAFTKI